MAAPAPTLADRQFALMRPQVDRLGPEAFSLLEGYFARVEKMDAASAKALTRSIAVGLAAKLGVELDPADEAMARALLTETYLALREHLA